MPVTLHTPELYISRAGTRRRSTVAGGGRRRRSAARAAAGDGAIDRRRRRSKARSATCRRGTRPAPRRCSTLPDAARGGRRGDDPVRGPHRAHRGVLDAGPVQAFERRGAIAQIYIHPGERIHEGICTSIWGAPTAESIGRKPAMPVVCINHADGEALDRRRAARRGPRLGQDLAARGLDALPAAGRRDPRPARIPTSSCWCTATTIPGTKASATTPPATRRCSSWRACSGRCATG